MFFSNTLRDTRHGNRRRIDHRQFLNVVGWRYPIMLRQQMAEFHGEMPSVQSKISLALPRSHCPHCQQTIRIRDNIPLLSWLMLKGRCRDCQAKISKRYPLVELLTALAFLLASLVWPESGWGLAVMILSARLIAASIVTSITNGCPMFLLRAYCGPG